MVLKRDITGPRSELVTAVRRVLVIEDSAPDALLLELAFEELAPGVQVHLAHDGEEALHALATLPEPDLVLLDLHLPGRDGLELLALLRARLGDAARVVCWSSRAQPREEGEHRDQVGRHVGAQPPGERLEQAVLEGAEEDVEHGAEVRGGP